MNNRKAMFLMLAVSVLLYAGCASKPDELIQQTEKTRQEAKDTFADQFALDDWNAGEKAWGQAEDALQKEDYGQASTFLLRAKDRYMRARQLALGKKEEMTKRIEGGKNAAGIRLKNLAESIAKAPAAKKKDIDASVQEIEASLAKIDEQVKEGLFSDAEVLAQRALRSVWELEQQFKK